MPYAIRYAQCNGWWSCVHDRQGIIKVRYDDGEIRVGFDKLLIVRRSPGAKTITTRPRFYIVIQGTRWTGRIIAINLSGVEPPAFAWFHLPHCPKAVHIRMEQEHKGIMKGIMGVADTTAYKAMGNVVRILKNDVKEMKLLWVRKHTT